MIRDVVFGLLFILSLLAVAIGIAQWISSSQCAEYSTEAGIRTKWKVLSGCYVEVNGRWIPIDNWREVP